MGFLGLLLKINLCFSWNSEETRPLAASYTFFLQETLPNFDGTIFLGGRGKGFAAFIIHIPAFQGFLSLHMCIIAGFIQDVPRGNIADGNNIKGVCQMLP